MVLFIRQWVISSSNKYHRSFQFWHIQTLVTNIQTYAIYIHPSERKITYLKPEVIWPQRSRDLKVWTHISKLWLFLFWNWSFPKYRSYCPRFPSHYQTQNLLTAPCGKQVLLLLGCREKSYPSFCLLMWRHCRNLLPQHKRAYCPLQSI